MEVHFRRHICSKTLGNWYESAQFSPLAWTEVKRAGYLIYCNINQPEVLPGSIKLTIKYPYPYKSMKERD
jgi:hypothetical protein